MKLFQRIFATFCAVIVCAIFVASFSFCWYKTPLAENQFNQRRTIETTLMSSIVSAFNSRGDSGAREILNEWKDNPVSDAVFVILDVTIKTSSTATSRPWTPTRTSRP